jgi:hypothetical protein
MRLSTKRWLSFGVIILAIPMAIIGMAALFSIALAYPFSPSVYTQLESAISPDHQFTAVVARRADNQAMSSDDVFVLVGQQAAYTPDDLRKALRSKREVLDDQHDSPGDMIHLHWVSDNELSITCSPCGATSLGLAKRKLNEGPIHITYVGFPENSEYTDTGN